MGVVPKTGARLWYNGFVTVILCAFVFRVRRHADSMTAQTEVLTDIERKLAVLPPEALKLVADFVGVISSQYAVLTKPAPQSRSSLRDEPFIGMWADRPDMEDSTAYVRKLRQEEWT
jgi:hypothetical protein